MDNCLFCRIVSGELPSSKIYEDQDILIFEDIAPVAPVHWVAISKTHIPSIKDTQDARLIGQIIYQLVELGKKRGVDFRLVNNCGVEAGQTVEHLHFHLIAGRKLGGMA